MTHSGAPPAFQSAEEIAPARRIPIQREWALQRGVKRFVKRAVSCEHEFASHDRGRARSETEHIGEANRGVRRAWLDTELVLDGGRTFRCELKAPGAKIDQFGDQMKLVNRFIDLGHPAAWSNSVTDYGEEAEKAGVPLHPNWRWVADHEDELVAADIRKQEVRAAKNRAGVVKVGKPRTRKPSASRVARWNGIQQRVMG